MPGNSTLRRPKQKRAVSGHIKENTSGSMITYNCDGQIYTVPRRCRSYTMNGSIRHMWISPSIPTPETVNQYPSVWGDKQNNNKAQPASVIDDMGSEVRSESAGSIESGSSSRHTGSIKKRTIDNKMGEKGKDKSVSSRLSQVVT